MEFTDQARLALVEYLSTHNLSKGLGTTKNACSVAAINLAISGELADAIPDCMSEVIGKWIIRIQDMMPDSIRNSLEWKELLPMAAGTGRDSDCEKVRFQLIMDWMWGILVHLQPIADDRSFGVEWRHMLNQRTAAAAYAADAAAAAYAADAAYAARAAAVAAAAAAYAADAAAAAYAADAACASRAAAVAADAAAVAADAAYAASRAASFWIEAINPCGLLQKLAKTK